MTLSARIGSAGLLVAACCACTDEPTPWWDVGADFEWQGRYVTMYGYGRDIDEECGESFAVTDEYVGRLGEVYGMDAPIMVDYHWLSRAFWDDAGEYRPCGDNLACTVGGQVFTRSVADMHELAHAVSWDVGGSSCMSVLEEGLATYFSAAKPLYDDDLAFGKDIEDVLVLESDNYYKLPGSDYQQAGHFVAFLIENLGLEAVRGLCNVLPRDASLGDWDAAMRSVVNATLADVLADYTTYPVCDHHGYRARLYDCSGEPNVSVSPAEETVFSFRFACDEPDVIGTRDGTMMLVKRVRADVPKWYSVYIEESDDTTEDPKVDVQLFLEQCAPCSEQPYVAQVRARPPEPEAPPCTWVYSPSECEFRELSGTHAFIFFLDAALEREVTVRIGPSSLELP